MRVLHVIDSPGRTGLCGTLAVIADVLAAAPRAAGRSPESMILGGAGDERLARACGLCPLGHLAPPRLWSDSGWRSLDRYLEQRRSAGSAPRILHAWGDWSAAVIAAVPGDHARVLSITCSPPEGWARTLAALPEDRRPGRVLLASEALRSALGGPAHTDGLLVSHLPPALDASRLDSFPRSAVRARWQVDEETAVLGLLGEPAAWSDAVFAAAAVHRLVLSGRRIVLAAPASCGNRAAAQRLLRRAGRPDLLLIDDALATPWMIASGLDACLFAPRPTPNPAGRSATAAAGTGDRAVASPIPVLWAMAAGVPVVAARSGAAAAALELIEDGESGLLFADGDLNGACRQVLRLLDDRALATRLGAAAARRTAAFAPERSAEALEAIYAPLS